MYPLGGGGPLLVQKSAFGRGLVPGCFPVRRGLVCGGYRWFRVSTFLVLVPFFSRAVVSRVRFFGFALGVDSFLLARAVVSCFVYLVQCVIRPVFKIDNVLEVREKCRKNYNIRVVYLPRLKRSKRLTLIRAT